ncbi:MAG: tRNA uracil 4-sulfurtransferase ThiI [Candidatus Neomarinimicrobiota bacterium]
MNRMKPDHILCHYAEIGLKGGNRRFFEKRLKENIKEALKIQCPESYEYVKRIRGRILIQLTDKGKRSLDEIEPVLGNTFGIAYFAFARLSEQEMESLKRDSLEVLSGLQFDSFRVTARRGDQSIPFGTQDVNEKVGSFIVENLGKKVDLSNPDVACHIDLVQRYAFIYTKKIAGRGGLPVGISGKVVAMVSGGIDSPVATYYAMKRGAHVVFLHFHSVPYTSRASIDKVREVVDMLKKFQPRSRLLLVKFAPIQKEIMLKTAARFRVILYRRLMFRIAEAIAKRENAHAIVTGESLGQVASQTLENMEVIEHVVKMPILRPLVGFDKQEIVDMARDLGTYEISIQPDQDCCSLFLPKRPSTGARLEDVEKTEEALDIDMLVDAALDDLEHSGIKESRSEEETV